MTDWHTTAFLTWRRLWAKDLRRTGKLSMHGHLSMWTLYMHSGSSGRDRTEKELQSLYCDFFAAWFWTFIFNICHVIDHFRIFVSCFWLFISDQQFLQILVRLFMMRAFLGLKWAAYQFCFHLGVTHCSNRKFKWFVSGHFWHFWRRRECPFNMSTIRAPKKLTQCANGVSACRFNLVSCAIMHAYIQKSFTCIKHYHTCFTAFHVAKHWSLTFDLARFCLTYLMLTKRSFHFVQSG